MAHCEVCGKIGRFGRNVSHSKRHTSARWLPNVHRVSMVVKGTRRQVAACTRCIRNQFKGTRTKAA
ncbi:MAG: 50S ribosomal protein L28 [Chloroflexi bacterium]|nr:50S ribosomal protein L28 [Chloroflexota bacterium]